MAETFIPPTQNWIDRTLAPFAPGVVKKRIQNRFEIALYEYNAARPSRERRNESSRRPPQSSTEQRDRIALMRKARHLVENFPIMTGLMRSLRPYVVGNLRYESNTGDDGLNNRIEEYLNRNFENLEAGGRHDLISFAGITLTSWLRDGDVGISPVETPDGLRFEIIESDCIGGDQPMTSRSKVGGVNLDKNQRAISYDIYERGFDYESYSKIGEIPAYQLDLVMDTLRASEYRGVTAFHSVIDTAQDLLEIIEGARNRVKFGANLNAIITNETGVATSTDLFAAKLNGNTDQQRSETPTPAGMIIHQAHGDSVEAFANQFPDGSFPGFMDRLVRMFAGATGLSLAFSWDMSSLTGPAVRMVTAKDQRQIEWWQSVLRRKALEPIKNRLILYGALSGQIKGVDANDPRLYKGRWMFPAKLTIDSRDERVEIDLVKSKLKSADDYYADRQKDWRQMSDQIRRERVYDRNADIDATLVPVDTHLMTANGIVPNTIPAGTDDAKDEPLINSIGAAGIAALNDTLARVATGEILRESGLASLEFVFGVPRERAERMIPEAATPTTPDVSAQQLQKKPAKKRKIDNLK